MKKISKILLFLLMLPLSVSFSACNKNAGSPDNSNQDQVEQPKPDKPDDEYGSQVETYSVSYDYNLPEEYDFLLADKDFVLDYIEVGTSTKLVNVPDNRLKTYFLGWCKEGSSDVLNGTVSSDIATTVKLKGKWDESSLRKYYYSSGLNIDVISGEASIYEYTGNSNIVIIPEVYTKNEIDYKLSEIQASVFKDKGISKVINNADDLCIGTETFKNTNISEFDFDKVAKIGDNAFENTKFENLKLNNNILEVGAGVFKNCNNLVSVDFDENSIDISDEMFLGCEKLETLTNVQNVTRIDGLAFADCIKLKNTDFIGPSVRVIEEYAFQNCVGLTSVTLPETLNNVYESIFDGCNAIEELRLGKTFENTDNENRSDTLLKHIGNIGANVKKITLIGNSITRLSKNYFNGFSKLESFIMSDSVTLVEPYAFKSCRLLEEIVLSDYLVLDTLSYMAFEDTKYLENLTTPLIYTNKSEQEAHIIYVPKNITPVYEFPADSVITKINQGAFADNKNLQKITIPSTIVSLGESVFKNCTNLQEVVFEENSNIKAISDGLFYGCSSLTSINLTALTALETIGNNSFVSVKVSNFILPASLKSIGKSVFFNAEIESFLVNGESENFVTENGVLYSVSETKKTLVSYPGLKLDKIFVCPNDVTEIDAYAFSNIKDNGLKYLYFTKEIDWVMTRNGDGAKVYTSFNGVTTKVKILTSNLNFEVKENVVTYKQHSYEIAYNFDTNEVSFADAFSCDLTHIYFRAYDQTSEKTYFICLELETEIGENDEIIYSVKENSLFKLEVDF